jgi:hypothetical protein
VVPRWRKLTYSFASVMVGNATLVALLLLGNKTPAQNLVWTPMVTFAGAVAGWIIAIPLILKVNNVSGWRFWLYLGIGSSSGPIVVFVALLVPFIKYATRFGHAQNTAVIVVTLIALGFFAIPFFVGTLTYLLVLRKAQISALRRMNLATVDR